MCSLLVVNFHPPSGNERSGQQINVIDWFIQLLRLMYSKKAYWICLAKFSLTQNSSGWEALHSENGVKTTNCPQSQPERCQMTFKYHLAMRVSFTCKNKRLILCLVSGLAIQQSDSACSAGCQSIWCWVALGSQSDVPAMFLIFPLLVYKLALPDTPRKEKILLFIPRMPLSVYLNSKSPNAAFLV